MYPVLALFHRRKYRSCPPQHNPLHLPDALYNLESLFLRSIISYFTSTGSTVSLNTFLQLTPCFKQQSPSWEANRFPASQEIPCILWNPKVHYRIHKCPPLVPILCQLEPSHPTSWRSILILSSHLCLGLPGGLFPSGFPTKNPYTPLLSPIRATCATHLILLVLITRIILREEYSSLSSPIRSFLRSPKRNEVVTSFLLRPKNSPQHLFSNTLSLHFSLEISDQFSHPYTTTGKIIVLDILIFKFLDSKLEDKRFCAEWFNLTEEYNNSNKSKTLWFISDNHMWSNIDTPSAILKQRLRNKSSFISERQTMQQIW